jgi:hypothetical protein
MDAARLVTPTLARTAIGFLSRKGQEELSKPEPFRLLTDCHARPQLTRVVRDTEGFD